MLPRTYIFASWPQRSICCQRTSPCARACHSPDRLQLSRAADTPTEATMHSASWPGRFRMVPLLVPSKSSGDPHMLALRNLCTNPRDTVGKPCHGGHRRCDSLYQPIKQQRVSACLVPIDRSLYSKFYLCSCDCIRPVRFSLQLPMARDG